MRKNAFKVYPFEERWFRSLYRQGYLERHSFVISAKELAQHLREATGRTYYSTTRLGRTIKRLCPEVVRFKEGEETIYAFPREIA